MMLDALLEFVAPGSPQSMVGTAGNAIALTNVIDILGQGVGTAPGNIIGNRTLFGQDPDIGIWTPEVQINIGTAFATGNAATANFAIQYAPDTGAAGGYAAGTWETAAELGPKPVSELSANQILRMALPPAPPNTLTPRYI